MVVLTVRSSPLFTKAQYAFRGKREKRGGRGSRPRRISRIFFGDFAEGGGRALQPDETGDKALSNRG
jgi:hypothetical protein